MVTLNSYGNAPKRNDCFFWGLSTDVKPIEFYVDETSKRTAIENGSIFVAMDTMEAFLYDAENKTWHPVKK